MKLVIKVLELVINIFPPDRQASEVHAAAAKARQAGSRQEKSGDFQVKTAVFG